VFSEAAGNISRQYSGELSLFDPLKKVGVRRMAFDFEDDDFDLDSAESAVAEEQDTALGEEGEEVSYYTEAEFRARGVDPVSPTAAKPGSEAKVLMLAARYAAGLPLWHDKDCYDHAPHVDHIA
jgi:hypothetical protein